MKAEKALSGSLQNGFTFIELMVTVLIIGIIAAVGYPMYSSYVVRGKLVEGPTTLSTFRVQMEQYYQDNMTYAQVGVTAAGGACGVVVPAGKYDYSTCAIGSDNAGANGATSAACGATPKSCYIMTAKSRASQGIGTADGDYTYTIDQANNKRTLKFAGVTRNPPDQCWILKQGDSC